MKLIVKYTLGAITVGLGVAIAAGVYFTKVTPLGWVEATTAHRYFSTKVQEYAADGALIRVFDYQREKEYKQTNGGLIRVYSTGGGKYHYTCKQPWRIWHEAFDMDGYKVDEFVRITGTYNTGRSRSWFIWQKKPNFSCSTHTFVPTNIPW